MFVCVPTHQFGRLAQIWNGEEVIVTIKSYTGTTIINNTFSHLGFVVVLPMFVSMLIILILGLEILS